jgi:hypothetical protein
VRFRLAGLVLELRTACQQHANAEDDIQADL